MLTKLAAPRFCFVDAIARLDQRPALIWLLASSMLRQLGIGVIDLDRVGGRFFIFRDQPRHHRLATVEQSLQRPRFVARKRVGGEQRKRYRRIEITDNGIREPIGVDLAPTHRFGRRRARKSAGVRPRIGYLQEVVVPFFVDAEYFLNLRLGLQHEILGTATAQNHYATSAATTLGFEADR